MSASPTKKTKAGAAYGRHPALVTSERLLDAGSLFAKYLTEEELQTLLAAHHILARVADEATKPRELAAHGTLSGYQRHLRHRETPCVPCKRAKADWIRDWRSRRRDAA